MISPQSFESFDAKKAPYLEVHIVETREINGSSIALLQSGRFFTLEVDHKNSLFSGSTLPIELTVSEPDQVAKMHEIACKLLEDDSLDDGEFLSKMTAAETTVVMSDIRSNITH